MNEGGRLLYTGAWAGPAVRARRRGRPAVLRPEGRRSVQPAAGRLRPAAVPRARRLAEQRRDQRRAPVLARRVRAGRRRRARSRDGRALRRERDRRSVRRPVLAVRPRRRGQPEHERVVRVHERHPGADRVPAVQQLAVEPVRQAGRAVLAAHRRPVRLLPDRRRHLQAADPRDRGAGRWRRPHVLELVGHRARTGTTCSWRPAPPAASDWTTLPDANGHTRPPRRATAARPAGATLHPQLDHYQTFNGAAGTCTATGTTGRLERRLRQLRRLAAVEDRPQRVRRQDGRDLDRVRVTTGRCRTSACSSTT